MYGFAGDLEVDEFAGLQLNSVTFAENLIGLSFEDQIRITVLSHISYRCPHDDELYVDAIPASQTALVGLIGQTVSSAEVRSRSELAIHFEADALIQLIDDDDAYEALSYR